MRSTFIKIKALKNEMLGGSHKVRPDPPSTVDRPWNSVVLSFKVVNSGNLLHSTIVNAFNAQVGAGTNTPSMEFRYQSLRAWDLGGGSLAVQINDLVNANPHHSQHDQPGRNHWSAVALEWSNVQRQLTVGTGTTIIGSVFSDASATDVEIHLHLLWRFAGMPAPTSQIAEVSF